MLSRLMLHDESRLNGKSLGSVHVEVSKRSDTFEKFGFIIPSNKE